MVKREDTVDKGDIVTFIAQLLQKLVAFRQARLNGQTLDNEKEEPWMADFNVEDFM